MEHAQHVDPLAVGGREPGEREFHAGEERMLTAVGMFRMHPLHQARQLLARLLNTLVAQVRCQQRQRPRVTLHRFDQIFDGLTRRRVGVQSICHARS